MSDNPLKTRYRIKFAKTEAMRYTGHLDLHRSIERSFRRAQLPLAYSQGFNPRPRIHLASALPLGFTSQGEIADVWLDENLSTADVQQALEAALPPGIIIINIKQVDLRGASLQTILQSADFTVIFLEPFPELEIRLNELLSAEEILRERRGKSYDLRPLIEDSNILPDDKDGCRQLYVRLSAREGATGRPEEVIAALGYSPQLARIQREDLLFQSNEL
jgi:radical SAM-linked protein